MPGRDVTSVGAYERVVPLTVPAYHGIEPSLSLAYSSAGPDGWLGVGWRLSSLSEIRRQAPGGGVPAWDASDTYSLDGRELVLCPAPSDSGPASGWAASPSCAYRLSATTAYTTRIETLSGLTSYRLPMADDEVWHTDGVKDTYLPGDRTSKGVLDWHLSAVEDPSGNVVTYTYAIPSAGSPGALAGDQAAELSGISYGTWRSAFRLSHGPTRSRWRPETVCCSAARVCKQSTSWPIASGFERMH